MFTIYFIHPVEMKSTQDIEHKSLPLTALFIFLCGNVTEEETKKYAVEKI